MNKLSKEINKFMEREDSIILFFEKKKLIFRIFESFGRLTTRDLFILGQFHQWRI